MSNMIQIFEVVDIINGHTINGCTINELAPQESSTTGGHPSGQKLRMRQAYNIRSQSDRIQVQILAQISLAQTNTDQTYISFREATTDYSSHKWTVISLFKKRRNRITTLLKLLQRLHNGTSIYLQACHNSSTKISNICVLSLLFDGKLSNS